MSTGKNKGVVVAAVAIGAAVVIGGGLFATGVIGGKDAGTTAAPATSTASAVTTANAAPATADNPVIARINGKEVRRSEFDSFVNQLPAQLQQMPKAQLYPLIVDELVATKLIGGEAEKAKLAADPEVQGKVAQAQQTIMQNTYLQRTIKAQTNDALLRAKYDEFVKANPPQDEVRARHILLKTEAEAKAVIAELDKGVPFEKLAKEKSTEPGAGESGGDLGYFTKEKMVPEFAEAAFKLEKDKYTKTPVHSSFGYHVVQVLDKRKQQLPAFETVKAELESAVGEDLVRKIVADLRASAKIEKFNLDGTPMVAPAAPAAAAPAAGATPAPAAAAPATPAPAAAAPATPAPAKK